MNEAAIAPQSDAHPVRCSDGLPDVRQPTCRTLTRTGRRTLSGLPRCGPHV